MNFRRKSTLLTLASKTSCLGDCSHFNPTLPLTPLIFLLILNHYRKATALGPLHKPVPVLGT